MRKLLKKCAFVPDRRADDVRSYAAAVRDLGLTKRHHRGRGRNNRAENSHQPTRRRERRMQGFKSVGSACSLRWSSTPACLRHASFGVMTELARPLMRRSRNIYAAFVGMGRRHPVAPGVDHQTRHRGDAARPRHPQR